MPQQIVLLAAGLGKRLGKPLPKPLTRLRDGESIMRRAVRSLREAFAEEAFITAVVGFKMDLVIEEMADISFVYNEDYDTTNTSKSLLKALRLSQPGGVLWMNGDVVFDPAVLPVIRDRISEGRSFVCVNTESVAEEEVKYTLDDGGHVKELSKVVTDGLGEAVGINYIAAGDKAGLIRHLEACEDQDYFERGIELAITEDGLKVDVLDISAHRVVEVDFQEDLTQANEFID